MGEESVAGSHQTLISRTLDENLELVTGAADGRWETDFNLTCEDDTWFRWNCNVKVVYICSTFD